MVHLGVQCMGVSVVVCQKKKKTLVLDIFFSSYLQLHDAFNIEAFMTVMTHCIFKLGLTTFMGAVMAFFMCLSQALFSFCVVLLPLACCFIFLASDYAAIGLYHSTFYEWWESISFVLIFLIAIYSNALQLMVAL